MSIRRKKKSITPQKKTPANTCLVSRGGPDSEGVKDFETRFWDALVAQSPDIAAAMANPLAIRFAQIGSVGSVCNAEDNSISRVDWRDRSLPLARRAAAFANARLEQEIGKISDQSRNR